MSISTQFRKFGSHYFPTRVYDFTKLEERMAEKFKFRGDDVVVVGFPKSGIHWLLISLREMYKSDWGIYKVGDKVMEPLLEWLMWRDDVALPGFHTECRAQFHSRGPDAIPSPRLFRSHLPREVFPLKQVKKKGAKVIHIARNPKDVCVSSFYYYKTFFDGEWEAPWDRLVENDFAEGTMLYGPYVTYETMWHEAGLEDNVLHIYYEDMKTNYRETLEKMAQFIGRPVTVGDIERTHSTYSSISNMKPSQISYMPFDNQTGSFFRKGVIGNWKEKFTVAQNEQFDKDIVSELHNNGITFRYE
ncbi:sulfotransferase 1A1-like [Saccoglossus kowalevskii]|uniref:Sulfotransferase family cytosolic 1B member 1-like n=1 Tax=Saccoglossus kowalevskii TaxID=10224 RepID=A0ABM0GZK8_SACKO|nr:PREDICTED: sulfotransferase family cytosolic 1B member 1-like [Saccoglossus kowalevskii]